jgi:hypothetical protein
MIIINLSEPSQVLTARNLPIAALNTIKVAYDHTCIVYTRDVCRRVVGWLPVDDYWSGRG